MSLEGSKTHENLKAAFAGESQANRRYLYFARAADIEGYPEAAGVFKNTADGETEDNLKAAVAGETYEYTEMYPGFAATAREEGFDEVAEWFETLARAEKSHAGKFQETLDSL